MNFRPTKITGVGTNEIFGYASSYGYPFGDSMLAETVLRYIALKKNKGVLENLSPIRVYEGYVYYSSNFTDGNLFDNENNEANIFLVRAENGYNGEIPSFQKEGYENTADWRIPVATILTAKTKIETAIYVNKTEKKAVIFVRKVTSSWTELLCSLMFLLVPWLYKEDNSDFDETEKSFFRAINKGDNETFEKIINDLCAEIDFEALRVRSELKGWFDLGKDQEIKRLETLVESRRNDVRSYEQHICNLYNEISNNLLKINALNLVAGRDPDEFYNLFKSRGLTFIRKGQDGSGSSRYNYIEYSVVETIEFYDKDEFLRVYNTRGSYMHSRSITEEARKVFYGIFAEEKGKFRTEAVFRLQNTSSISAVRNSLSGYHTERILPHPHLYYHACLGGNQDYIQQFLDSGDVDMALDQTVAATKNLNFGDSIVCSGIMANLYNNFWDRTCIIADNGQEMSPREFLKYITPEEKPEEKTE